MPSKTLNVTSTAPRSKEHDSHFRFATVHADVPSVIDDLMAAGALLPAQMSSAAGDWSPEKKLAGAVLASALREIQVYHGRRSHQRGVEEACEWVRSSDTAWPFSFLRLCALFDWDPEWVRAEVERWMSIAPHERERKRMPFRRAA